VQRALIVLGSICRYHEISSAEVDADMEEEDDEEGKLSGEELTWSNLIDLSKHMFTKYLEKNDPETKCAALRALCGVFLAQPREMLLMDQSGLLTEVMSPTSPLSVQMESLRCWRDVLLVRLQQETDAVQIHNRSSPTHPRLRNNSDGRSSN
jgi:hypothetical protein